MQTGGRRFDSRPAPPDFKSAIQAMADSRGRNSVAEYHLAKVEVVGSTPTARSISHAADASAAASKLIIRGSVRTSQFERAGPQRPGRRFDSDRTK